MGSLFYLLLAGLFGGFIAGLVGIGGGIIYVFIIPMALFYLGVPLLEVPQYTIANSIFAIFCSSLIANFINIKSGNFFWKEVFIIGFLGIISSTLTIKYIVNTPNYSIYTFNIILIILLIYMLYSTILSAKKVYFSPLESLKGWKLSFVGIAGGVVSALSGLGGGVIIIPILNSLMHVDIRKAGSISLGVISITSFFITLVNLFESPRVIFQYNYAQGYIIYPVVFFLSLGGLVGTPLGVKTAKKISQTKISYIYGLFLFIVIIKKIYEIIQYS